jgi:hypothetical protein
VPVNDFIDNENNTHYDFIMNEMNFPSDRTPDQLRAVLLDQFNAFWERDTGVERDRLAEVEKAAASPHAVTVSGLRRVGKSTLMAQFAHRLGKEPTFRTPELRFPGIS